MASCSSFLNPFTHSMRPLLCYIALNMNSAKKSFSSHFLLLHAAHFIIFFNNPQPSFKIPRYKIQSDPKPPGPINFGSLKNCFRCMVQILSIICLTVYVEVNESNNATQGRNQGGVQGVQTPPMEFQTYTR